MFGDGHRAHNYIYTWTDGWLRRETNIPPFLLEKNSQENLGRLLLLFKTNKTKLNRVCCSLKEMNYIQNKYARIRQNDCILFSNVGF